MNKHVKVNSPGNISFGISAGLLERYLFLTQVGLYEVQFKVLLSNDSFSAFCELHPQSF